jgi:hypothetical protein
LPGVSSVVCNPSTLTAGGSASCVVTLTAAVPSATAVTIQPGSASVTAPGTLTIAAGASSGQVTATAGTVASTQTVQLTASLNNTSASATLTVNPPAATGAIFYLNGNNTELPNLTAGAAVMPRAVPAGVTGSLVMRGSGSVTFSPFVNGGGMTLGKAGAQQANTAFVNFTGGSALGSVFNSRRGDLTFYVQSNHSLAERVAMGIPSFVFDVGDGVTQRLYFFSITGQGGRLAFDYRVGSDVAQRYTAPVGTEDQLLGKGVTAKFRLTWDGSRVTLYINDQAVVNAGYVPVDASWNATASFALGSTSLLFYGGGYYTCDDGIAEFQMR